VIPPNADMTVQNGALNLTPRKKIAGKTMGIDVFFRSLARDQKEKATAVILSGAGTDGALGIEEVKAMGGLTFAQDSQSAKFDGMPNSAVATGCVDFILSPAG